MHTLFVSLVLGLTVQQQIEGGEIGDGARHFLFDVGGKYRAQTQDKVAGNTTAAGTWAVKGDAVEVKVESCKGPACKELEAAYRAEIALVGERGMTVRSTPASAPLSSGSYYCRYQGCARRYGVMVAGHDAKPLALRYVVDTLIDKNRARDTKSRSDRALAGSSWVEPTDDGKASDQTLVWEGERLSEKQAISSITWCKRDEARGKKAAEQLVKDLSELGWVGRPTPKASADGSCLWDVRLVLADDVKVPERK